jgi:hypothetical protein
MPATELKKAEIKTFVRCPHCEEFFAVSIEQKPAFLKDCVFCRRTFQVVAPELFAADAKIPEVTESVCL